MRFSLQFWRFAVFIGLVLGQLAGPAQAQLGVLLHRQQPNRQFGFSSDTEFSDNFGNITSELMADRFILGQGAEWRWTVFHGFYGGQFIPSDPEPPPVESFLVRLYSEENGLPGQVLHEEQFSSADRQPTGAFVSSDPIRREYRYQVKFSTGVALLPNVPYWLAIAQINDPTSNFRWETATGGELAGQYPIGNPWVVSTLGQLAYELRTPEPTSALLLALGVVALCSRRRLARN